MRSSTEESDGGDHPAGVPVSVRAMSSDMMQRADSALMTIEGDKPMSKQERLLKELVVTQERWKEFLSRVSECTDLAKSNGNDDLFQWIRSMY